MKIIGNFLGIDINTIDDIYTFFEHYNEKDWEYMSGGYLKYINGSEEIVLLVQKKIENSEISLTYSKNFVNNIKSNLSWNSLGNEVLLNDFLDVGDNEYTSLGTFISFKKSWEVIYDFFQNPTILSNKISWVSSEKIDWDKLYNGNF